LNYYYKNPLLSLKKYIQGLVLLNPQDQQEFDQGNKSLELGAIFTV
jgi:hypothetical protein